MVEFWEGPKFWGQCTLLEPLGHQATHTFQEQRKNTVRLQLNNQQVSHSPNNKRGHSVISSIHQEAKYQENRKQK